jgi:hypothetical protein
MYMLRYVPYKLMCLEISNTSRFGDAVNNKNKEIAQKY